MLVVGRMKLIARLILCHLCGLIIFSFCQPSTASDVRISRPTVVESGGSCCSQAKGDGLDQAIVLPGSALAHFNHWRKRYIDPVFCPVLLCHGSCGDYDDACILERGVVLNRNTGCAGSCN
jgi:hypothetical protein